MALTISLVLDNSIAKRKGIKVGDQLLEINGEKVRDFVDFIYFEAMQKIEMLLVKPNGKEYRLTFDK